MLAARSQPVHDHSNVVASASNEQCNVQNFSCGRGGTDLARGIELLPRWWNMNEVNSFQPAASILRVLQCAKRWTHEMSE